MAAFLNYLWWFVGMSGSTEAFDEWSAAEPPLVGTGLGSEYPPGFEAHLTARNVPEPEFHLVVCLTTEVLYTSLFGACDEPGSRQFLDELAALVEPLGVPFPDLRVFAGARWDDGDGWGRLVSSEQLADWRAAPGA
ncbi:MAG: hypothetical protein JWN70_922 [Planctomycetaceae bacterium]|nr:hypothetical protein [Planctomycetaceae bacterium]